MDVNGWENERNCIRSKCGQTMTKVKFIALDGLGAKFDLAIVHITSKLHNLSDSISLKDAKFTLQRYEQRLNKTIVLPFGLHGNSIQMANQVRTFGQ